MAADTYAELFQLFYIAILALMAIMLYASVRMYRTTATTRRQARRAQRLAEDVRREWESFNRNQSEQVRHHMQTLEERAGELGEAGGKRMADLEAKLAALQKQLDELQGAPPKA